MRKNWMVKIKYRELLIDISLNSKITILLEDSGCGKTFLSKKLKECEEVKDNVVVVDATSFKELNFKIAAHNKNGDSGLIIFDNADLYMSDLVNMVSSISSGFAVIICKSDVGLCNCNEEFSYGHCTFKKDIIKVG